jgi:hypothetical protein
LNDKKARTANTWYSLLPLQYQFQGFRSYLSSVQLDKEVLRNRQQTIPPSLPAILSHSKKADLKLNKMKNEEFVNYIIYNLFKLFFML